MSLFASVELVPGDPILGLTEAYNADPRTQKVNLGVGIYYDEQGRIPLLDCVRRVEEALAAEGKPRGYLPIDGLAAYDAATRELVPITQRMKNYAYNIPPSLLAQTADGRWLFWTESNDENAHVAYGLIAPNDFAAGSTDYTPVEMWAG